MGADDITTLYLRGTRMGRKACSKKKVATADEQELESGYEKPSLNKTAGPAPATTHLCSYASSHSDKSTTRKKSAPAGATKKKGRRDS